ncbi:AsmA family protein [Actibacterium pelagium]|uniref:Cell envelope biogenesis protein AsmA n=1 Tax=Actibacterium pelagium TaxID=2029103 RepID=A0A917AF27_9RHOB|nr:AsmA family protein [Actibacterium pelagium]GGE47572.1 cell envelope biogenesis protein AsmA [Actibacterium pelagium]
MRRLLRFIFTIFIIILLAIGALFMLPADRIAGLASDQIRAATGRDVTFDGRFKPSLWPQIGLSTDGIRISNAEWSDKETMISAKALSVGLDMASLLKGSIRVSKLELIEPIILLEKAADGRVNWEFSGSGEDKAIDAPSESDGSDVAVAIDQALISAGTVRFIDHSAGTETLVAGVNADLTLPDFAGPANLGVEALVNGQSVRADLSIAAFEEFMTGSVAPMKTSVRVGKARIDFDGRAGISPVAAEGQLDADLSDLRALTAVAGQPAPSLPAGVGQTVLAKGQVTLAPQGSLHLRNAALTLDSNKINGSADLTFGDKPFLSGAFEAGALDFSAFTGGSDGGGGEGWSTDPIDVSALGAMDADVSIVASSVDLGDTKLGRTNVLAKLTDRRLVLTLREVRAYDGTITGEVVINGRGGLSVGGDLNVASLSTQSLLKDLADYDRLLGTGDFSFKFLGSGNSMKAIMNSLSGSGSLALGQGEIRGFDLAGMLRNFDTSFVGANNRTIYESIGASFSIKDGVLQNSDLSFLAPLLKAAGLGQIGIGSQTLNYQVAPTAFGGSGDGDGIKVPLKITGTWANPKFNIDLEELARQRLDLDAKKQALEDKAKDELKKLEDKAKADLAKKLGLPVPQPETPAEPVVTNEAPAVSPEQPAATTEEPAITPEQPAVVEEEPKSPEDLLKDKLEDEAKKSILKLLGNR